ncbi:chaoptin-like [Vanessa atalanta]|uniref:chaoptin-like n=1 Tax=Vanessa atalanta TaxID=42275 RepID=UPI001FCE1E95|nr:chaoptin-like [Vanessa atalanta]XP_047536499.1 chaoptin-like [Vanessa atalanta]
MMTMKNLICIILTIYQIVINYSHCEFLDHQPGCHSDENICVTKMYCVDNVDFQQINIERIVSHECNDSIYYSYNRYVPIWLYYKIYNNNYNTLEEENTFQSLYHFLSVLDITFNNYETVPTIYGLPRLELLNVSHNEIITAKLYNEYDLVSLKEIDLSYNKIKIIDDNQNDYYIYSGLKKIWLSHNELSYLPDTTFNKFYDLELLDLSYNLITNITLLTFDGINHLKILKLSNNGIVDINSSLFRFNKLVELYLNNNKLENVLVRDFKNLNELEILDLSDNYIVNIEKNVFNNLISLKQIDLSGNLLTVIGKSIFSTNIFLNSINLSANELTEIPTYLFQAESISFFAIEKNNIQGSLKKGTFVGLKLSTRLDISYQSITSIEDLAFLGLDSLKELLLNNNIIRSLSNKSFKTLKSLLKLDLSFNLITQIDFDKTDLINLRSMLLHDNHIIQIKKDYFESLPNLQFLDLSQNHISKIDIQSFQTLERLSNILMNKNPIIGNLEAETLKGLNSIPMLDLSHTLLNVIMNASFDNMINLSYLNISHSKVKELQYNTFLNTENIEILDLSYNEINVFSLNSTSLVNLKQLLLNNNNIITLFGDIFKGMPLLNRILLSHNLIKSVDDETFKYQKHLMYLDLSFNSNIQLKASFLKEAKLLKTLILSGSMSNRTLKEFGDMSQLTNLEVSHSYINNLSTIGLNKIEKLQFLDLSYNNMTQLETGVFAGMGEIYNIDISYNQLNVIEPGVFKDNHMLNLLNISHNNLLVISYGVIQDLIGLRVLDISYNFISDLEAERFYAVANLEELIVDHNRITDISIEKFGSTTIKKLSIGDNPLPCDKVYNLIKHSVKPLVITALRYVKIKEENLFGITCIPNQKYSLYNNANISQKTHGDNNFNVLTEIRDILLNLNVDKGRSEERKPKNENIYNDTQLLKILSIDYATKITELSNGTLELNEKQEYTNKLLDRILKVVVAMNSLNRTISAPVQFNVTSENFVNYINQLRQDFDNAMILDKEKILAEVDERILLMNKRIESVITANPSVPQNEKMTSNIEPKSSIFVETCVAFILLILVCIVLYKAYKSRFYVPRRRSISTRNISDAMDTSNV